MAGITLKSVLVAGLAAVASALPAQPRFTDRQLKIHDLMRRQSAGEAALGITDFDILQFALTLEWLETSFYQQGFAAIGQDQFLALGLTQQQVTDLIGIGTSESAHVQVLQSTLAQQGVQPVEPCQYNFGDSFSSAQAMVQTATLLEQVGVSAYLGAAPLVSEPTILAAAASIYSIEARHQSFIRTVSGAVAAPNFFDTPLSPKAVFSLAAPFITSCPTGSNLALTAFPPLTMAAGAQAQILAGSVEPQMLALQSDGAAQAQACAFVVGDQPTGATFTAFANGQCATPQGLNGVVYLNLVSSTPADGKITDDIIVAGPMVLTVS